MPKFTPYNRHSIRLKDRNYSEPGAYFITICAYKYGICLDEPEIRKAIEAAWFESAKIRPYVGLDEFIIMPNHLHGIIVIKRYCNNVGAYCIRPFSNNNIPPVDNKISSENKALQENKLHSPSQTIGAIIRGFKAATTSKVNKGYLSDMSLWQRNYYEHIIRNKGEFDAYRKYIRDNPANWDKDVFNPVNFKDGKEPIVPMIYR